MHLNSKLVLRLIKYFETKPVSKAWIFGSYARGEESDSSDIDILVEYETGFRPGLFGISLIIQELEGITGKKIDLVENGYLYPRVAQEVESQKIQIYERKYS